MLNKYRHKFSQYLDEEDGTTAVEFGMVAFGFLILLFSIVEAGYAMWWVNTVQHSIKQGARYAAVNNKGPDKTKQYIRDELQDFYVDIDKLELDVQKNSAGGVNFIELRTDYTYIPIVGGFLPVPEDSMTFHFQARHPVPASTG